MSSRQRLVVLLGLFVYVALVRGQSSDEDDCQCVAYYLCVNGTVTTEAGRHLIDRRVLTCNGSIDVCCKLPDIIKKEEYATTEAPYTNRGCGHRNPDGATFTLDGALDGEANFGEFPWMVAVLREEIVKESTQGLTMFVGGGSLIHPRVVLTAAHTILAYRDDALRIRAGEWDTQTKTEELHHQDRVVSEVIIHEDYNDDQLLNDIALLILQEPVIPAEHIDFVCLPSQGQNFDFSNCFANGWGKDLFGQEGRYQTILKKVKLPIVPNRPTCQDALRKARLGPAYLIHESFICAGGSGTADTCRGDGGSPLVCPMASNPDHYQQAGIVSWGLGCGETGLPGVYVNVALFKNWIDRKMANKNFDTSYYTYAN